MLEKKFCRECGSEKKSFETSRFDENTGKRIIGNRCENLKCEDGCENITKHNNWSCWRNKCLDCGYVQIDY